MICCLGRFLCQQYLSIEVGKIFGLVMHPQARKVEEDQNGRQQESLEKVTVVRMTGFVRNMVSSLTLNLKRTVAYRLTSLKERCGSNSDTQHSNKRYRRFKKTSQRGDKWISCFRLSTPTNFFRLGGAAIVLLSINRLVHRCIKCSYLVAEPTRCRMIGR